MAEGDFNVKAVISANTKNFDKGMKQAQTSANNLSNTFVNLSKVITKALSFAGLAVGVKAVVDFGKSCVQSATEATKQFNVLDNTIRATGADAWTTTEKMDNMAKSLSDSSNYSVTEIEKMQSVLLGFRDITGDTFKETSDAILDMATVMGMDLTSAAQTVGKALDDPIKGSDSLRRQGFQFTDEQKTELAQMVKTGNKMQAQKIILDELARSYGGAAKAGQDSFAKQRHAIENLKDTLGTKLIPIVQIFAEDNAKMFNRLRELIEKTDFTPIINVITNLKKIISEVFGNISDFIKQVGGEIKDFINRFNFAPLLPIFDTLIGLISSFVSKFKEIGNQKFEFFDKLKESLITFSNSETFEKIVIVINKIIDAVFFLWERIQEVISLFRQLINETIINVWGKIKELFENSSSALENSGQEISSWGEFFYSVLDNIFKIFQDLIYGIKAILQGDWSVAWEYAKLTVLRVVDNILKMISTVANAFPELINGMINALNGLIKGINKVRGFLGQDPLGLIDSFKSIDLSKDTGLTQKIKDAEDKIKELTGNAADTSIKDLENVSSKFSGFTKKALGSISGLTDGVTKEVKKQKLALSSIGDEGESSYKMYSEWDVKLLNQRLEKLEDYQDEYHEIQIALIEEDRKKALENAKDAEEMAKINKYYDELILRENERMEKAKREQIKKTLNMIKNVGVTMINVFKNVVSKVKNIFSSVGNIFLKIFDFNIDDALNSLLEFEDKILTFFTSTLPNLPSFFESAIGSITHLIDQLISILDFDQIASVLSSIINSVVGLVDKITKTISADPKKLTDGIVNMLKAVVDGVSNWLTNGGFKTLLDAILTIQKALEEAVIQNLPTLVDSIIDALPDLIDFFVESIKSATRTVGKIIKPLIKLIISLIFAIVELLNDQSVIDELVDTLPEIIKGIIEAIIEMLPKLLSDVLPKVLKMVLRTLFSLIPELVGGIIEGIIQAFVDADWGEIIWKMFKGFVDGIKNFFGIHSPSTMFADFGKNMIQGLWNGIKNLGNWLGSNIKKFFSKMVDGIKDCFKNIGNWFKDIFSKAWDGIKSAWNGVTDWFKDIANGIGNAFASMGNWIKGVFEKIGDWVEDAVNAVGNFFKEYGKDIGLGFLTGGIWNIGDALNWWATGTNDAPKGLSIVGEAGPELVNFKGGERVYNATNTEKILAGANKGGSVFNVTFNNTKDTTAYGMMTQLKLYQRNLAFNGVL